MEEQNTSSLTYELQSKQKISYVEDTFEEYLSKKDHIAASDLKNFMKSPMLYQYEKYHKDLEKKAEQRHFSIGSGLHEMILQPKLFSTNYVVAPKFDRRTKVGKEAYAEFQINSEGKTILFEDEMDMIRQMADNGLNHATFMDLIKESVREISCYTTDAKTGLKLRMRPDSLATNKSTITDIKSCLDSSAKKFKGDVYNYGYSLSAAYYCDFLNKENYVFAAMEKKPPFQIGLYVLNDEMMDYGRSQYRTGLDLLKWSYDNDYWCNHNEFELLKECYDLGDLESFFDVKEKSQLVTIL